MGLFDIFKKSEPAQPQPSQQPVVPPVSAKKAYTRGDVIGNKYEVIDILGKGGYGIVYQVYSRETHSVYALKTFLDKYLSEAPIRERFKKEASVWVSLDKHPYIVTAHFVIEITGRPFIGMEYIEPPEGGWNNLEEYLKYQQVDYAQGLRWAIQFCYGMEHAYIKGIKAHRDIKPVNIMISSDKSVKISDFGLAGFISADKSYNSGEHGNIDKHQTMMNTGVGTPTHMPPEQFISAADCDERSDIYSFGVVLYQIASGGELPFITDNHSHFWQIMRHMHSEKDVPKLNSKIDSIIQRCMAKNPNDRFQSFVEIRKLLEALLKEETGEEIPIPELSENTVRELSNKGLSLNNIGLFSEAIECLDRAILLNPKFGGAWCNKGLALTNLGKYDEAKKVLLNAINIDSRNASAWTNLGLCHQNLGEYKDAYDCYNIAVGIDSSSYVVHHNIGNLLYEQNNFDGAICSYDVALKIFPHFAPALSNKGKALMQKGNYQSALPLIDESLKINPLSWYALFNKAECHKKQNQYQSAIDSLQKSININANSTSLNALGSCYFELAKYDNAMECFQKTLEIDSSNLDALRAKILCFWSMGQAFDAHMFSRMALAIIPNDPFILFLKASIEDHMGHYEDARQSYMKFVGHSSDILQEQIMIANARINELSNKLGNSCL